MDTFINMNYSLKFKKSTKKWGKIAQSIAKDYTDLKFFFLLHELLTVILVLMINRHLGAFKEVAD